MICSNSNSQLIYFVSLIFCFDCAMCIQKHTKCPIISDKVYSRRICRRLKSFLKKVHPSYLELGNQHYCCRLWTYCSNHSGWKIGDDILRHHRHSFVSPLPLQHRRHHGQKFQMDLFKAVQMSARSKISGTYPFR